MANRSRHLAPVVAACCLAWASVLAQDGRPALRQLPPAINSLLTELGEGQIGYLEGLWRIGGGAASNAEQLQGFRNRAFNMGPFSIICTGVVKVYKGVFKNMGSKKAK